MRSVWPATQSQLYGELGKLPGAGLIEIREQIRDSHHCSDDDFFARAVLENGLRFTRMQIDWADRALDALDQRGEA
jgi:hypothetical protein